MKLVTLDHLCTIVSKPSTEMFRFVDLCGGPGGFSEYFLWRREQQGGLVQGWGISLRDAEDCQWKLSSKYRKSMHIHYGNDGTGNLYDLDNIEAFASCVAAESYEGVDVVVADGGFVEARDQPNQEELMHQLILCEILTMFKVLAPHGTFLCKTFEVTDPFSIGLMYLLYHSFEELAIVKPVTSRPASSERYVLCKNYHGRRSTEIICHLTAILENLRKPSVTTSSLSIVSSSILQQETALLEYIRQQNNQLLEKQIQACEDILCGSRDTTIFPGACVDRDEYYTIWQLPS